MATSSTRLVLICGLPASGKTTLARQLAPEIPAVRLDKDQWTTDLGLDVWDAELRVRIERQLWGLAQELLASGQSVILEWGHWARAERDEKRLGARALGVGVELRYLDVPLEELIARAERRNASGEWTASPMTRAHFEQWATIFQPPDEEEMLLFDEPVAEAPRPTGHRLRRGVYLPPFGPFGDPNAVVDLAVRAEAAGWDGVFLWDHVVGGASPITDPWTTLGAMSAATRRILLGPTVTPLPRRRPWVVARQASTVSRLSGGRLILGVGLGSDESGDFGRFGEQTDLATRAAMLDEGLDVLRAVWSGERLDHTGAHYDVHLDATDADPHAIPIWIASSTRHLRVLRRAARCNGIFPISDHTLKPEQVADIVEALRAAGGQVDSRYDVVVAGNASSAWERPNPDGVDLTAMAEAGATWWMESLIHFDPLALSLEVVDAGPP